MSQEDALRPGEQRLAIAPDDDAALRFIGHIETPFPERADCPRQGSEEGPECTLVLKPDYAPALLGLDGFDRIEVLYWLHRARRDLLTQNPGQDGVFRGTFSLRSPLRPNPIGTSVVRLIRAEGCRVTVRGLDCLDQTPLLDIKPCRCDYAPLAKSKNIKVK